MKSQMMQKHMKCEAYADSFVHAKSKFVFKQR